MITLSHLYKFRPGSHRFGSDLTGLSETIIQDEDMTGDAIGERLSTNVSDIPGQHLRMATTVLAIKVHPKVKL